MGFQKALPLKGLGRMFVLLTSGVVAMACQGCAGGGGLMRTSETPGGMGQAEQPPVRVSRGIRLATTGVVYGGGDPRGGVSTERMAQGVAVQLPRAVTFHEGAEAGSVPQVSAEAGTGVGATPFADLAWSGAEGVRTFEAERNAESLVQPVEYDRNFSAEIAFAAPREQTGLAVDVGVAPSLSYLDEGRFKARSFGAEVRLGRDFDQRGEGKVADRWYVFAGAEGEALVWETGEYGIGEVTDAVALRDQVTVGDMQAGLSVQRGAGQLSLSYIRRDVEYSDRNGAVSKDEHFAGVSFTLRR